MFGFCLVVGGSMAPVRARARARGGTYGCGIAPQAARMKAPSLSNINGYLTGEILFLTNILRRKLPPPPIKQKNRRAWSACQITDSTLKVIWVCLCFLFVVCV